MLNLYYWYAVIWGIVLVLYSLKWSDFCIALDPITLSFFITSILVSVLLGFVFRNKFRYTDLDEQPIRTKWFTRILIFLGIIEFVYSKDIPLFSIILGTTHYTDFKGIPFVNPVLENLIIFYSTYLFYLFLESKNKNLLKEIAVLFLLNLLMFQKGILILNIFCIINLAIAKLRSKPHEFKIRYLILIVAIVLLLLYINGGLANLRTGVSWGNTELPIGIGKINDKWPKWLPLQFSWAYSYIVSPLANLNYNIIHHNNFNSITALFAALLPESIVKRIWPSYILSKSSYILITPVMNACTGFIESALAYGKLGLWFYYFFLFLIFTMVLIIRCSANEKNRSVFCAIMCMMVFGLFFYNTLRTASTSFLIFIILIEPFTQRIELVFNGKKI